MYFICKSFLTIIRKCMYHKQIVLCLKQFESVPVIITETFSDVDVRKPSEAVIVNVYMISVVVFKPVVARISPSVL